MIEPIFLTQNVAGIGGASNKKRRLIFNDLHNKKIDFALLQETHSTKEIENLWKNQWGGEIFYSHGTSSARGTAILISKRYKNNVKSMINDEAGRLVAISIQLQSQMYTVASIYAPNEDNASFFVNTFRMIEQVGNDYKIIAGDFNTVLDLDKDLRGGKGHSNAETRKFINEYIVQNDMLDIWRLSHPDTFRSTFNRSRPVRLSERLDYILISSALQQNVIYSDIPVSNYSDHAPVTMKLNLIGSPPGKGYWKFNNALLTDDTFIRDAIVKIKNVLYSYQKEEICQAWETMKMEIRIIALKRGKQIANSRNNKIKALEKKLQHIVKERDDLMNTNALDFPSTLFEDHNNQIALIKSDIDSLMQERTAGAVLCCRISWLDMAEKPSKYFFALEKHNYNKKTIVRLENPSTEEITTDPKEILQILYDHFRTVFSSKNLTLDLDYLSLIDIPQVKDRDKLMLDGNIQLEEIHLALKQLRKNKCPGTDGLTPEFYLRFWNLLGKPMHRLFLHNVRQGIMHTSAREGVIMLMDKPNRDHLKIRNWRPLSMLNTDNKIYAKVLANRLDHVLPYLIIPEQIGFMKGRSISDNILDLLAIIQHCKNESIPAAIISLDIFQAFDSIQTPSMIEILRAYGFGEPYIDMISLCFKDMRSIVINNGKWSPWLRVESGVRQGCVISPKIFLLAIQILALKIKQNPQIQGITIDGHTKKLGLCADDMWNVIQFNQSSFSELVFEYGEFEDFTGLSINYDKTEILRIGSLQNSDARFYTTLPIKWSDGTIKVLGTHITPEYNDIVRINYEYLFDRIDNLFKVWSTRNLTPYGKIQVVNSLASSQFVYKLQCLPSPNQYMLDRYAKLVRKFVWDGKPAKIAYKRLIASFADGGLQLRDLGMIDASLKASKFYHASNQEVNPFWFHYYTQNLKIERSKIPYLNIAAKDVLKTFPPTVFRDMLYAWAKLNYLEPRYNLQILKEIIWYNSAIKVKGKVLFNEFLYKAGINRVIDIFDLDTGQILTYENMKELYPAADLDFLSYYGITKAIPIAWKRTLLRNDPNNQDPKYIEKTWIYNVQKSKKKLTTYIYSTLRDELPISNEALRIIWNNDLKTNLSKKVFLSFFSNVYKITVSTKLRYFQYRLICKALTTNVRASKWDPNVSPDCTFCQIKNETVYHLFIECPMVQKLWTALAKWFKHFHDIKFVKNPTKIIFNAYQGRNAKLINISVLIAKFYIYKTRSANRKLSFIDMITDVNHYKELELHIHTKKDQLYKFARKWDDFSVFD